MSRRAARLAAGALSTALTRTLALIYPPSCAACGTATADPGAFCPSCWSGLRLIEEPRCDRLGIPFAVDLGIGQLVSPLAFAAPPVFARARAAVLYDDVARRLVHRLKYEDRLDLAKPMARMMAGAGGALIAESDCVVPVPLHRWRLWRRRFNQAALLARPIAEGAGLPLAPTALARVRATRTQVGLSRAARAENLAGAFRVPPSARHLIAGRRILLIDDVMTTRSTANAASRALIRGGAASVNVLTFALVGDPIG
ncbi:ComF family protein [Methylobacterium aerolatum]|uniref:ComF family protein n=1 Tax=Methylobacterium aerolatum TaxID=418708 RepID=A0ABU0HZV7_9HYPH|nr:ComF family protein [Methylobacterium aerolatum]MDQ0446999.1 ComF family protein [Methylobacterium aerolatum]GJD36788.1 hypothetical protein FMGBMHLM_3712 [Methylobacterium aerolatum]